MKNEITVIWWRKQLDFRFPNIFFHIMMTILNIANLNFYSPLRDILCYLPQFFMLVLNNWIWFLSKNLSWVIPHHCLFRIWDFFIPWDSCSPCCILSFLLIANCSFDFCWLFDWTFRRIYNSWRFLWKLEIFSFEKLTTFIINGMIAVQQHFCLFQARI